MVTFDPSIPDPVGPDTTWDFLQSPWFWTGIGLFLLGSAIFWFLWKNRVKPGAPADVFNRGKAIALLEALRSQKTMPPRDTAAAVWYIVRRYLAQRYRTPALYRTTYELFMEFTSARQSPTNASPALALMGKFLPLGEACEACEFGKEPPAERREILIEKALEIIQKDSPYVDQLAG